jgi:hypothetical protein
MTRCLSSERLNCEEILKQKDLWALSDSEFKIDENLKEAIVPKLNDENNIIYSIIKTKFQI